MTRLLQTPWSLVVLLRHLFNRYMNASARMDACHPYLGCAPEGQRQLAEFLHVELAVLYFPFSLNDPILATTQADRPSDLPAFL